MNVAQGFAGICRDSGDRAALISGLGRRRRRLSFAALERQVDAARQVLVRRGLQPGDRVLLAVPLSLETYIAMLAILKAGMVIMFIDPAHGIAAMARCLRAHPPAAIAGTRAVLLLRLLLPEMRKICTLLLVGRGPAAICNGRESRQALPAVPRADSDAALLTFTSGSTGTPKGVLRSHGFLRSQMQVLGPVAGHGAGDIELVAMPMFVLFNLAHGVTSVLPACSVKRPERARARVLHAQLCAEQASRIVASPALLERLADYCSGQGPMLDHLRCISTGGGPVPPGLAERLAAIAPQATIRIVYGSTEAEPIAAIDSDQVSVADQRRMHDGRGLLVGKPVAGCDLRILSEAAEWGPAGSRKAQFLARCVADNVAGEIVVAGKHVLSGYADRSRDAGTKIDIDGRCWHRTGDAGYLDSRGRLWLLGRCAAAVSGTGGAGGMVFPFQVEYAVSAVRGIRRAALLPLHGAGVLVLEIRRRRAAAGCVRAARRIAGDAVERILVVRRIPLDKRHGAKVDYAALRAQLGHPGQDKAGTFTVSKPA
ncbi:MAG: fatty acid CoA ligase family protein [Gammaproteobacteria bacterium]|nr:MAG: fatty acid CoA ligase family protein [Gammaproteobacteria bacterium]